MGLRTTRRGLLVALAGVAVAAPLASASAQYDVSRFGERWLQIESHPSLPEARAAARGLARDLPGVRIMLSESGWFALVLGPAPRDRAETARRRGVASGVLPADSQVRAGRLYIAEFDY